MNLLNQIKLTFTAPPAPKNVAEREDDFLREIVAARSHGNIYLQMGLFDTAEDVDEQFKRLSRVRFAD